MAENTGKPPMMPPKKYIWDEIRDDEVTTIEGPSGHKIEVIKADGFTVPKVLAQIGLCPDMRINIPKIREMTVREDDVLICAFAKAGTHWLWEVTSMLKKGRAEYVNLPKESAMLEFHKPEEFDSMKSPRIFNTHLRYGQIPKQMIEKKCKIIFIQRNPKDVTVSMYNHKKTMNKQDNSTFEDQVALFGTSIMFCSWYDYTLNWEKVLEDNHSIYSMYYEDLKRDPVGEIKKLAEYLEVKCDDQLVQEIANKCNFDQMKKANKEKHEHVMGDKVMSDGLYRKGQVGDWKNWFTVAQNERFDAEYKQKMKDSKFKFTYVLP